MESKDEQVAFPEIRIVDYPIKGGGKYTVYERTLFYEETARTYEIDQIELNLPSAYVSHDGKLNVMMENRRTELDLVIAVCDLIDHEYLHMLLYHLGEEEGCRKLDLINLMRLENLENLNNK